MLVFAMEHSQFSRSSRIILIAEFVFVAYMLYALTTALYKSYQIDRHIAAFEEENVKIGDENKQLSRDFAYYTSVAYQEKIAKQNFGLVRPGEQVIILSPETDEIASEDEFIKSPRLKKWDALSNSQKWWRFFFERAR